MRLIIPATFIALTIVVYYVAGWIANRQAEGRLDSLGGWKGFDNIEDCDPEVIADFATTSIREDARRWRNTVTGLVVTLAFVVLSLSWIENVATDADQGAVTAREAAAEAHAAALSECRTSNEFRGLLVERIREDERVAEQRYRNLARQLEESPAVDTAQVPGYAELAPAVRTFIDSFLQAQVLDARERLLEYQADFERLRGERIEGERLLSEQPPCE